MFIDIVNSGWVPIYNVNLSDVIGYIAAPAIALSYPWTHLVAIQICCILAKEIRLRAMNRQGLSLSPCQRSVSPAP